MMIMDQRYRKKMSDMQSDQNNAKLVMKIPYFTLLSFMGLVLLFSSCRKTYESVPLDATTDPYIWDASDSNATFANQYLRTIYAKLPLTYNRIGTDLLDAASDDAVSSQNSLSPVEIMATGGITVFSNPDNTWASSYAGIRMASIFLNNFGIVPYKNIAEKRAWFGEARVLRAYYYWELVKRFGGVPLIGDSIKTLTDNTDIPRNTFAECISYIVSECDRAKDSLRSDPVDDNNLGRWSKAGAMALKARVLLYAASPLYNGGGNGNELVAYSGYDANRWKLAADAAREVLDLNAYTLEDNFASIFISQRSSEVIFARLNETSTNVETSNGPPGFSTAQGGGNTSPTQELVDVYTMLNGKSITDPTSGYDPSYPYVGRDVRFGATILYNGAKWLNGYLETFDGGVSRPGGSITQTKTGYYMRKFLGNFESQASYSKQYHDNIYFRLGEVLLNYAEAENEANGPSIPVYDALEVLRLRAGLDSNSIASNITKDEMREVIRAERRKELAFEEHRFWDVKRWKIAGEVYNKPLHGVQIIRSSLGDLNYFPTTVLTTNFDESKMYFYPIPYSEMVANKNMQQNPGW